MRLWVAVLERALYVNIAAIETNPVVSIAMVIRTSRSVNPRRVDIGVPVLTLKSCQTKINVLVA